MRNLHPPRSPSSPQVAPRNEAGPPYIQEAGSPYFKEASPPDFKEADPHSEVAPCTVQIVRMAPSTPPTTPSSPKVRHVDPLPKEVALCEAAPDPEELLYTKLTQAGYLALTSSLQVVNETVVYHPCDECEEVFTGREGLKNHIEMVHES